MENSEEKNLDVKDTMQDKAYKVIKKCKEIAEKDFTKFSALFVAVMTVGLWVIKGMWYAYQSGRFSVYGIASCYITSDDESFLLQIIQLAAVLIVWFGINYLFYTILVSEDETKYHWKRKLKSAVFWIVEMLLLLIMVLITSRVSIINLIKDSTVESVVMLLIVLAFVCAAVNIYGIEFAIEKKFSDRKKKKLKSKLEKQKDIDDGNQHKRNSKNMIFTVFITVALEILLMYILGITYENDRSSYKIVLVEQEADEDSKYIFHYQSRQMNYTICPIVFENSDYYILTRLYKRDGKIEMDYEYQKIIEKTDTETFNCENIYGINIGE